MEVLLSLLLALSIGQAGLESVNQAREAKNTNMIESVKVKKSVEPKKVVQKEVKQVKATVSKKSDNNESWHTYSVTAYTAGKESTGKSYGDKNYGITASGEKVKENHTLACPKSIEFGTKIYIPYFDNTFVCEDRGGAIVSGKLDVYMGNLQDAKDFGRRQLKIKIID
ncbi:3D domain-containing protein [Paenibacillus sp. QZ-Y1]|uniref:3D domain-containing protein n=1 Tax=Paenibacillus sp. QZ-Y1 TaxID=3414511 RepID=UPI003F7AB3B9